MNFKKTARRCFEEVIGNGKKKDKWKIKILVYNGEEGKIAPFCPTQKI